MSRSPYRLEGLAKHDRSGFDCGVPVLNAYLKERVGQDVKRNYATCFVAVDRETDQVAGYYTLSMSCLRSADLPEAIAKKLPRYPEAPVARMGRLAIDERHQGRKLGSGLVADAVWRVSHADVGVYALVVDAKDRGAAAFYKHFGFLPLTKNPLTLFLPISDAIKKLG